MLVAGFEADLLGDHHEDVVHVALVDDVVLLQLLVAVGVLSELLELPDEVIQLPARGPHEVGLLPAVVPLGVLLLVVAAVEVLQQLLAPPDCLLDQQDEADLRLDLGHPRFQLVVLLHAHHHHLQPVPLLQQAVARPVPGVLRSAHFLLDRLREVALLLALQHLVLRVLLVRARLVRDRDRGSPLQHLVAAAVVRRKPCLLLQRKN